MAKIIRREWTSKDAVGKRVKHVAYGYTLQVGGKQERVTREAWASKEAAFSALHERLAQVRNGQIDRPADATFSQAVERYLRYKSDRNKRSIGEDVRILEKQMVPFFGATLPLRQLVAEKIARYEEVRIGQVSASTVRNELTVLRHLLRLANRKWGYLDRVPEIELPKPARGRTRFLTQDEIGKLLAACQDSKYPQLTNIVTLAIHTGARKSEILKLRWENIDTTSNMGFTARITLFETKNGEVRSIPLNESALAALTAIEPDLSKRVGPVFKGTVKVRAAFENAVKRAGLEDFRFHDLRHTCASHLAMAGRPLREIQETLGHKSYVMTLRYAHLSPAHLRSAVESLNGLTPAIAPPMPVLVNA